MAINLVHDATRRWGELRLRRLLCSALLLDALLLGGAESWVGYESARLDGMTRQARQLRAELAPELQRTQQLERRVAALRRHVQTVARRLQQRQAPALVLRKLELATPEGVALQEVAIDSVRCRIKGLARSPELALRLAETLSAFQPCPARGMAARDGADKPLPSYAFTLTTGRDAS
ncbi:hypothetical protein [Paludibacterium yongneupense]|uniref:hypothetical protein n=1 Tax=Paludibacterium yongneupense TaxID=400061 RepID=UPI000420A03C|nr:hypothetical protein [Paludibacterium yongneupense]